MNRIVVIGAAGGGVEALQQIVPALPADFPAAVVVVMHVRPGARTRLTPILNETGTLRAAEARDGEPLEPARIYVSVPDHHLIVGRDTVVLRRGPRENGFRPSADVLFRSAAHAWGARAIGVILSGALDDGASGLRAITSLNGIAVVQDPADALYGSMPMHAIRRARVDHVAAAAGIGRVLSQLVREPPSPEPADAAEVRDALGVEVQVAAGASAWRKGIMSLQPTPYTCPDCHGVMYEIPEGDHRRFRCHTGHGYTATSLLPRLAESSENSLWAAVRTVQEAITLMEETVKTLEDAGDAASAADMRGRIAVSRERLEAMRVLSVRGPGDDTGESA